MKTRTLKCAAAAVLALLLAVMPLAVLAETLGTAAAGSPVKAGTRYIYTLAEKPVSGGEYVLVTEYGGKYYAVSNQKSPAGRDGLVPEECSIASGQVISKVEDSIVWKFEGSDSAGYTVQSVGSSEYLAKINSMAATSAAQKDVWEYITNDGQTVLHNKTNKGYILLRTSEGQVLNFDCFNEYQQCEIRLYERTEAQEGDFVPVTGVTIEPQTLEIELGKTFNFSAKVEPDNATITEVKYTSSNPAVASVDNTGLMITGSEGSVKITATVTDQDGTHSDDCEVTVKSSSSSAPVLFGYKLGLTGGGIAKFSADDLGLISLVGPQNGIELSTMCYANGAFYGFEMSYSVDDDGQASNRIYYLDKFDPNTYERTRTQVYSTYYVRDMAYDPETKLIYCLMSTGSSVGYDLERLVYTVDPVTLSYNFLGALKTELVALGAAEDGRLYAIDWHGNLCTVDKKTVEVTIVGATGVRNIGLENSMTFCPENGRMYWLGQTVTESLEDPSFGLYDVNLATGTANCLGYPGCGETWSFLTSETLTGLSYVPGAAAPTQDPNSTPRPTPVPTPIPTEQPTADPSSNPTAGPTQGVPGSSITWNFDTDKSLEGWSLIDYDEDSYTWYVTEWEEYAQSGSRFAYSESYHNFETSGIPLQPDNWLITPEFVCEGGSVSFYLRALNPEYLGDKLGIYVLTIENGEETWSRELASYTTTGTYVQHSVDLSSYAGKTICVGFRHYDVEDIFVMCLDTVTVNAAGGGTVPATDAPRTEEPGWEPDESFTWDFDDANVSDAVADWMVYDDDYDELTWELSENRTYAHSGTRFAFSESFYNVDETSGVELQPDNWLITPRFECHGGYVSFYIRAVDENFPGDPVGVYVTTNNGDDWSDTLGIFTATPEYVECRVSLEEYNGSNIRIGFRHRTDISYYIVALDTITVSWKTGENTPTPTPTETPTVPPTEIPTETPPVEGTIPGDADGNGEIEMNDALKVMRHALGLEELSGEAVLLCDMDGDEEIRVADSLTIARMAMGLIK